MNIIQIYSKASQIIDALTEVGDQGSIEQVKAVAKEVQDAYFKEWNLPMPDISVRNFTNPGWLGQMVTRISGGRFDDPNFRKVTHTLQIQKSILQDPETLRRVVAHEMIHLWQNATKPVAQLVMIARFKGSDIGHGKDFLDYAAKINAIVGSEYITPKSDETYKVEHTNEYYVLITPLADSQAKSLKVEFGWAIMVRPSARQKEEVERKQVNQNAKLFKTKNPIFLGGAPLKKYGGFSYAPPDRPDSAEKNAELRRLFMSGEDIVLN